MLFSLGSEGGGRLLAWSWKKLAGGSRQICKEREGFELVVGAADEFASRGILIEEGVKVCFLVWVECCRH